MDGIHKDKQDRQTRNSGMNRVIRRRGKWVIIQLVSTDVISSDYEGRRQSMMSVITIK